jgi:large subunit ribosomal protein L25
MPAPILNAVTRTIIGKQVKQLRRNNLIPGIVYGHDFNSLAITLTVKEYEKIFEDAGTSTLVDLVIDNKKPVKVLLHEPQTHPVRTIPYHADFYVVKMTEKLETEIPIHFVGESEAVSVLDGTLTPQLDTLSVQCFPDKLVPQIEVNITSLKSFDDIIRVSDISVPDGIEILNDPEEVITLVTAPRSEEELAALEEAVGKDADAAAVAAIAEVEPTEEKEEETTDESSKKNA